MKSRSRKSKKLIKSRSRKSKKLIKSRSRKSKKLMKNFQKIIKLYEDYREFERLVRQISIAKISGQLPNLHNLGLYSQYRLNVLTFLIHTLIRK